MGANIQFKIDPDALKKILQPVMEKKLALIGQKLVDTAKENCPRDTGNLRNSIDSNVTHDDDKLDLIYGTPIEYGLYQEIGFKHTNGHFIQNAYLLPALIENEAKIAKWLGD